MTKGGKAADYYSYSYHTGGGEGGGRWPFFVYQKSANSSRSKTSLCVNGMHCKPYNELCPLANVSYCGMTCNDCAVVELNAKFGMTDTGCSTVSLTDPTSIDQRRITIQLTSYSASSSSDPKVPRQYRSSLGDTETAMKVYNQCKQSLEYFAAYRQEKLSCCYEGCGTQVDVSNCYCM